jgi:hypothetical protein
MERNSFSIVSNPFGTWKFPTKSAAEAHVREILSRYEWAEYHQINARLRCVCRKCNLSTERKQPSPQVAPP